MKEYKFVAPTLFGIEGILSEELKRMGVSNVSPDNGKVYFTGDDYTLAKTNIGSRFAERILIELSSFTATTFDELFENVKKIDFENYISSTDAFPVKGWSLNSKLFSVPDCQKIIKKAVVERLKQCYKKDWFEETGTKVQIQFSIMKDTVSIMIDTSGHGLHKRGYRQKSNYAPIRETLAAAMCDCARIYPDTKLYDPMCGSGTILIEAAMMAKKIAPGLRQSYAAERFGFVDKKVWQNVRNEAFEQILPNVEFEAFGSDIDPTAIELLNANAKIAGVEKLIKTKLCDVKDFKTDFDRCLVITNPPYGERLLDIKQAEEIYSTMGNVFEITKGKKYFIISPHNDFEAIFGKSADKKRKLYNGMIKCNLFMYFKNGGN